jgi:acyl-CoA synthetase (AMP-forming)/AMP-acid ligase II
VGGRGRWGIRSWGRAAQSAGGSGLADLVGTGGDSTSNWASALWEAASSWPTRPAIHDGQVRCTYADLRDRAAAYATLLADAGVRPGDRVGLFHRRTWDAAAGLFGIMAAGAVAVVLSDVLRARQVAHVVGHSGAEVLLVDPELAAVVGELDGGARALGPPSRGGGGGAVVVPRSGGDLAQLIYTSGSTGLPKGVMVTHGNLHAGVDAVREYLGIRPTDRLASLLPFSFDYGLNQLFVAVRTGATLVIDRSPVAARVDRNLRSHEVTVLAAVPTLWRQLLQVDRFRHEPIDSLRIMTNTGGRLGTDTVRQLRVAQPRAALVSMYGLTEAFRSTYLDPELVDRKPGSVGRAIPGAEVRVVRPDGTACAPFEVGEIVHRGPTVTLGYWRDDAATSKVFHRTGPGGDVVVRSGDFGWVDDDGDLYVEGRRDRMIKRLGFRVSPDEVVDAMLASGLVRDACVVANDPTDGPEPELVGHVMLADMADVADLERHLAVELPRHLRPDRLVVHDVLPTTPNGKPDLQALEAASR